MNDQPGTSHGFNRDSEVLGDFNEVTAFHKGNVIARDQEVKHVVHLKKIEKKQLEDYYQGTKGKKDSKKKVRHKKPVFSLSDLAQNVQQIERNDIRLPVVSADSPEDSPEKGDTRERHNLQFKIYNDLKMRESEDRKNQMQQIQAEENYLEEFENLADTWLEYKKRRNQLKQSLDAFQERPCTFHRMGCSLISRKYWSEDGDEVSPRERTSFRTKEKHKEVKKKKEDTRQQELGEEPPEKLVFVYDEDSEST